jgi:hypothetical protein
MTRDWAYALDLTAASAALAARVEIALAEFARSGTLSLDTVRGLRQRRQEVRDVIDAGLAAYDAPVEQRRAA